MYQLVGNAIECAGRALVWVVPMKIACGVHLDGCREYGHSARGVVSLSCLEHWDFGVVGTAEMGDKSAGWVDVFGSNSFADEETLKTHVVSGTQFTGSAEASLQEGAKSNKLYPCHAPPYRADGGPLSDSVLL